jgi:hypothetical protein
MFQKPVMGPLALLILFPMSLHAEDKIDSSSVEQNLANADAKSRFSVEISSYSYAEPGVMTKTTDLGFVGFGWQGLHGIGRNGLIYNAVISYGMTNYDGTGTTSSDPTIVYSADISHVWPQANYQLLAGFGYRKLFDYWGGKETSTGALTYDRSSEYIYASFGIKTYPEYERYFSVKFNQLIVGTQKSYQSSIGGRYDAAMHQESGLGLEFEYAFQRNYAVFMKYWTIENSQLDNQYGLIYEPKNDTASIGLKITLDSFE